MSQPSVLFIGGTGVISTACVRRPMRQGREVTILNRGRDHAPAVPDAPRCSRPTSGMPASVRAALGEREFDVVVDFLAFTPDHVQQDARPVRRPDGAVRLHQLGLGLPDAAGPPAGHRVDAAAQPVLGVLARQDRLRGPAGPRLPRRRLPDDDRAAVAHLRPHAACRSTGGWTVVERMRQGREVVVHGDGTSLWTLTHHDDFARGVRRPAGAPGGARRGVPHHLRRGADVERDLLRRGCGGRGRAAARPRRLGGHRGRGPRPRGRAAGRQVALDGLRQQQGQGAGARAGRAVVPFRQGAREIVDWHDEDPARRAVDPRLDALFDRLVEAYRPRPLA